MPDGEESCSHPSRQDGICRACGDCLHELILNGRCYYCEATDVQTTVRPATDFVPAARLRRKPEDEPSGS